MTSITGEGSFTEKGSPIVHVQSLAKTYRGGKVFRKSDVHALQGVSLQAEAGQVFGLLGPNGAGKTTLIKILLGVIRSSGGSASLFGLPAGSPGARRRVGYLPESLRVDRHHTARSALSYYGRLSGLDGKTIRIRSKELIQLVGLEGRDRESVKRFSKGMLQRLGLAQALMHDPDLLVLDEPTDGLDPVGRSEVRRVIERLRDSGKTIFLNSHILHEVELVCSHLAIMARGRVLATGPIAELSGAGIASSEMANADSTGPDEMIVDVEWELPGEVAEAVEVLVNDPGVRLIEPLSNFRSDASGSSGGVHRHALRLACRDQHTVDELVDRVRDRGGSLIRLQPNRVTLEDTFMRLVNDSQP